MLVVSFEKERSGRFPVRYEEEERLKQIVNKIPGFNSDYVLFWMTERLDEAGSYVLAAGNSERDHFMDVPAPGMFRHNPVQLLVQLFMESVVGLLEADINSDGEQSVNYDVERKRSVSYGGSVCNVNVTEAWKVLESIGEMPDDDRSVLSDGWVSAFVHG